LKGDFQAGFGLVQISLSKVDDAEIAMGCRKSRGQLNCLFEIPGGIFQIAKLEECIANIVTGVWMRRVQLQCRFEI
jgi:hypothetical protein